MEAQGPHLKVRASLNFVLPSPASPALVPAGVQTPSQSDFRISWLLGQALGVARLRCSKIWGPLETHLPQASEFRFT